MRELEVKIIEVNPEEILQKLADMGATKSFDGEMRAVFLDDSDKSIAKGGNVLRIRQEGSETRLTFKSHISKDGIKEMEELETSVADVDTIIQIFRQLGYSITRQTRKFRTQFDYKGTHIVLDDYQDDLVDIPVFVEIEAPDPESLFEIARQLGFDKGDCKSWNTRDLVKHYGLM